MELSPWERPLDTCLSDRGTVISVAMFWDTDPTKSSFLSPQCFLLIYVCSFRFLPNSSRSQLFSPCLLKVWRTGPAFLWKTGVIFQLGLPPGAVPSEREPLRRSLPSTLFPEPLVLKLPGLTLTSGKPCWFKFFWNFYISLHTFQIITEKYLGKNEKWTVLKSLI